MSLTKFPQRVCRARRNQRLGIDDGSVGTRFRQPARLTAIRVRSRPREFRHQTLRTRERRRNDDAVLQHALRRPQPRFDA